MSSFVIGHRDPVGCMDDAGSFALRNCDTQPKRFVPAWKMGTLFKPAVSSQPRPPWRRTLNMVAPPPFKPPKRDIQAFCPQIMELIEETGKRAKRRKIRWPRSSPQTDKEKELEILKWRGIIDSVGPSACGVAKDLEACKNEKEQWLLLTATFQDKAPTTLQKYAGALGLYTRWARTEAVVPYPFTEQIAWNYVSFLVGTGAPASRAKTFITAAKAAVDCLGMYCGVSELTTRRIKGGVDMCLARKRETRQAPPMSVLAVEALEDALCDERLSLCQRVIAGFVRFCVGARLRHADATRIMTEPYLDLDEKFPTFGFIETRGTVTKTSTGSKPIWMVAHSWGLKHKDWAKKWLLLRKEAGLKASDDETLMPACGPDWVLVLGTRMSSDTLTIAMREILEKQGIPREETRKYTSHSMKATFLSWLCKCGVNKHKRRVLGGHSKPGDKMVDLYGRDEFGDPLLSLGHAMIWVASRAFLLDSTRSGRWSRHPKDVLRAGNPNLPAAEVVELLAPEGPEKRRCQSLLRKLGEPLAKPPDTHSKDETSDVEYPESDVPSDDDHDEVGEKVEMCAAVVHVEATHPQNPCEDEATPVQDLKYCPSDLPWNVVRHVAEGVRHWSEDGKLPICPMGKRDPRRAVFAKAETHEDLFCLDCVVVARDVFGVDDAASLCYGVK